MGAEAHIFSGGRLRGIPHAAASVHFARQLISPLQDYSAGRRIEVLARPLLASGESVDQWFNRVDTAESRVRLDLYLLEVLKEQLIFESDATEISLNVFPETIEDERSFSDLVQALLDLGREPTKITIEIAERTQFACHCAAIEKLSRLQLMGFKVAIDDFGQGWNHILLIGSGAVSEIKLDRAWLSERINQSQLRSVVQFAHSLGVIVTAEGVETPDHYQAVLASGCDYAQGFYLDRPVSLIER